MPVARLALALLLVATSACGPEEPREPYDGCPAAFPPSASFAPEVRSVTAGAEYQVQVLFPRYPCIQVIHHCAFNLCVPERIQGACVPWLRLLEGPPGASALVLDVTWQTSPLDAGRSAAFRVRPDYPDGCAEPEQAWTVTVEPAAPGP